jgi:hypothetical protein
MYFTKYQSVYLYFLRKKVKLFYRLVNYILFSDKWFGERTADFEEGWFPKSHIEEVRNEHIEQRYRLKRFVMMRQIKQKEKVLF